MPVIEETVFIRRAPAEVFNFMADPANFAVWDSSVVEAAQENDGPPGIGSRTRGTSKVLGRHIHWVTEGTEFDPPNRILNTGVEGPLKFTVGATFEPVDGGTQLTYRLEAESGLGGVFGKMADSIIQRAQARTVRANLETLAELLENHPQT